MPVMKSALPDVPPVAANKQLVPPKTLYYQKDAAKPAASAVSASGAVPAVYQDPARTGQTPAVPQLPARSIETEPPGITAIRLQSDPELQQTIIAEAVQQYGNQPDNIFKNFPTTYYDDPTKKEPYAPRAFAPAAMRVEPMYVCYNRLYFEDKNSERYQWELGPLQPFVSAGKFYADLLAFPYHFGTRPCQRFEADAGYCLPGDPVPYLIYPVELSATGGLLQAGTVVGLYAIFP